MIERGEKLQEYREIKAHWINRLYRYGILNYDKFQTVRFSYGYTNRTMTFEIESITIGKGNPEWGAPDKEVFIIKLGKRVA